MVLLNGVGDDLAVAAAGGKGAGVVSGRQSIREVLERLVRDQRNYNYELSSPSTPGKEI